MKKFFRFLFVDFAWYRRMIGGRWQLVVIETDIVSSQYGGYSIERWMHQDDQPEPHVKVTVLKTEDYNNLICPYMSRPVNTSHEGQPDPDTGGNWDEAYKVYRVACAGELCPKWHKLSKRCR